MLTDSYNYGFNEDIEAYIIFNIDILGIISRRNLKQMNYNMHKGNSKNFTVYVKDEHLNIIDLTDSSLIMNLKEKRLDTNTIINKQGSILDAVNGKVLFTFEPNDTVNLDAKQYYWNVVITLSTGDIYTIAEGTIVLKI